MKKIILFALVLLLLLPVCHASDDLWFYNSEFLVLDMNLSTGIEIVSVSPRPEIDFITANISFYPKEGFEQKILSFDFSPEPKFVDDYAIFEWKNPPNEKLFITMESKVRVEDNPVKVSRKIEFPIQDLPQDIERYTEPAEIIDIDDNIINLASEIASGNDDLVDVVDSIAVWVNSNVLYNFSTVTAEASQKASWVLKNREGVCDELTSLFIAMVRSLGIPARFVAGISYTNSPSLPFNWGPHGWAEVYFPGYGWVPYDVTYGEYGWIDPTHVVSHVSEDAGKVVSNYQWRAESGVSLNLEDLSTKVNIVQFGDKKEPEISIKVNLLKDEVAFGSYNLVTASVMNLKNYYVSRDIYLSRTNRITTMGDIKKHVLLRPGEVREVYWITRVDDDLDRDYIYTFPVEAYTMKNVTAEVTFTSLEDADSYSLEDAEKVVSLIEKGSEKAYSKNLEVNCSFSKDYHYVYEKPDLSCTIKNMGNLFLKNLDVCLEDDCREILLGITQKKQLNFTVHQPVSGENIAHLDIKNEQMSWEDQIAFDVLDEPKLDITDIEFPAEVRYKDKFALLFTLKKESDSEPQNARVEISGTGLERQYNYDAVDKDMPYKVDLSGKDLEEGKNRIQITADYMDKNGKAYSASEEIELSLVDVTFFQRIMLFIRGLFR